MQTVRRIYIPIEWIERRWREYLIGWIKISIYRKRSIFVEKSTKFVGLERFWKNCRRSRNHTLARLIFIYFNFERWLQWKDISRTRTTCRNIASSLLKLRKPILKDAARWNVERMRQLTVVFALWLVFKQSS